MGKARWRALVLLVMVTTIILAMSFAAWSQCRCDLGDCTEATPMGSSEASFTIPLGAIGSIACALSEALFGIPCETPEAGVLIADIRITLNRALEGETSVGCPDGCCGSGALFVDIYAYLWGQTKPAAWLPPVTVTGFERVKRARITIRKMKIWSYVGSLQTLASQPAGFP